MTATASDLSAAITPGSTEYGDRQTLETGLATAVGGQGQMGGNPAAGNMPPPVDAGGDPLSAILSGAVKGDTSLPATDGMSVGPGMTPNSGAESPMVDRVRQVALNSKSPVVRALARQELRRLTAGGV